MQAYHKHLLCCLGLALALAFEHVAAEPDTRAPEAVLMPFKTDGCSMFPDGTLWDFTLWRSCCVVHDLAYWQGGDYMTRMAADDALRQCVDDVGEPIVGVAMLLGVRLGGSPYWPTEFRWGYGWKVPRGYRPLSNAEAAQVEQMLKSQAIILP
ncbi:MAG TPA: FAD-binding oxidoreductase [Marinagarivorans sp.]